MLVKLSAYKRTDDYLSLYLNGATTGLSRADAEELRDLLSAALSGAAMPLLSADLQAHEEALRALRATASAPQNQSAMHINFDEL